MRKFYPEGFPCHYCGRLMDRDDYDLHPTKDHLNTKAEGGKARDRKVVWCCRACNSVRGDMALWQWRIFMDHNPEWYLRGKGNRGRLLWEEFILGKPLPDEDDIL